MGSEERRGETSGEEDLERGGVSAELVGGNILKIRWVTGKTSAAKLFGKYGREGRPDFFRLLFGAIGGSLRSKFPENKANEIFRMIRNSQGFKDSLDNVFNSMKKWFFDEVVPKYKLKRGDVFAILTTLELNIDTGELKWDRENTQVIYWVRSDRIPEKCRELGVAGTGSEEIDKLKRENEELTRRINELTNENSRLITENEESRRKLEEIKRIVGLT